MAELAGKVAVVTGAGRGIGRAAALALAQKGADVVLTARNSTELLEVKNAVEELGRKALVIALDLSQPSFPGNITSKIEAELGPVDILINNAGVAGPFGSSWELDPEEWEKALRVNLVAPFWLAQAVLPQMLKKGWGRIINVSSGAARNPIERGGPYSVSKAGLDMLTRQLAVELAGTGVVAISVYPGVVDTVMQDTIRAQPAEKVGESVAQRFKDYYLSGQLLPAEKPGELLARLATSAGAPYHGQIVDIYSPEAQTLLQN
jgi:NAD(P)-dependent dehydrogenase (short-subunit alcohol dehydrogenase family)